MRFILLIIFLLTIGCSIDTKTGIWNKKINEMKLSQTNIGDLNQKLPFDEYKKIIVNYGKYSEFPNID
jgi:serine protease inhibitor